MCITIKMLDSFIFIAHQKFDFCLPVSAGADRATKIKLSNILIVMHVYSIPTF